MVPDPPGSRSGRWPLWSTRFQGAGEVHEGVDGHTSNQLFWPLQVKGATWDRECRFVLGEHGKKVSVLTCAGSTAGRSTQRETIQEIRSRQEREGIETECECSLSGKPLVCLVLYRDSAGKEPIVWQRYEIRPWQRVRSKPLRL